MRARMRWIAGVLIWVNDRLVDEAAAVVSVLDHGLTVGDGVFATLKVLGGTPFALTRHLRRLAGSALGLGLPAPSDSAVRSAIDDGRLSRDRLASHEKLERELARAERKVDARAEAEHRRRWKSIHKQVSRQMREKYREAL